MKQGRVFFLLMFLIACICCSAMASQEWADEPGDWFGILPDGTIVNITEDGIPEGYMIDWGTIDGYTPLAPIGGYPPVASSSPIPPEETEQADNLPLSILWIIAGVALSAIFLFYYKKKHHRHTR